MNDSQYFLTQIYRWDAYRTAYWHEWYFHDTSSQTHF